MQRVRIRDRPVIPDIRVLSHRPVSGTSTHPTRHDTISESTSRHFALHAFNSRHIRQNPVELQILVLRLVRLQRRESSCDRALHHQLSYSRPLASDDIQASLFVTPNPKLGILPVWWTSIWHRFESLSFARRIPVEGASCGLRASRI